MAGARGRAVAALAASALVLVTQAGAHTEVVSFTSPTYCTQLQTTDTGTTTTTDGTTTTSDGAMVSDSMYTSGSCYDWSVSPSYTGTAYSSDSAADASEPPPPAPVTRTLPTWRNLYDWANGHGYAGWHTASSSQAGAYGMQTNLGGQYGLWLWPVGGQSYSYSNGNYAEFTYGAPGTTRLANATVTFSYRNKLLAHHCIDIGFRAGTTIVAHNEHCIPAAPPDSQRQVTVSLVDPTTNPTSKTLYVRIRVSCGGATTCSKNIPALDPLSTGGFVRVTKVDMTLVDDDNPTLQLVSDKVDTYNDTYSATIKASDAGSGIKTLQFGRDGQPPFASANAPCDATHNTPALDNRICPQDFTLGGTLDISNLEDGTYTFTATATDLAGNVGTFHWTVTISRVSLDIALNPLMLFANDKYTSAKQVDFGWRPTETIPKASVRQTFKWRVALAGGQSLTLLPDGTVGIVDADQTEPDDSSSDPNTDADAADPSTDGTGDPTATEPDDPIDDSTGEANDGTWDDDPGPTADEQAAMDAMGAMIDVLTNAQDETDNHVAGAGGPAAATDAAGMAVPVTYAVSGNIISVTIAHHSASYAYPITATAPVVEDPIAPDDSSDTGTQTFATTSTLTTTATSCNSTKVVTYDPRGWEKIFSAFKANPATCADYYIGVAPVAADKRFLIARFNPGGGTTSLPGYIRAAGTHFHAVAEFNWGAWERHMPDQCKGANPVPCPTQWRNAAMLFRTRMACAGYNVLAGATWALNEFGSRFRSQTTGVTRSNAQTVLKALFAGGPPRKCPDGSTPSAKQTEHKTKGIAYVIFEPQNVTNLGPYKSNLEHLLTLKRFWQQVKNTVLVWSQESYADCRYTCVGSSLYQRQKELTSFLEHPLLLANAAASTSAANATSAARALFHATYMPLMTAYTSLKSDPSGQHDYGHTELLEDNYTGIRALVSLQIYARRRFDFYSRYQNGRIGFAWNNAGPFADQLATYVAKAVQAAYSPGSSGAGACSVDGTNVCTFTFGSTFNRNWDSFRNW